LYRRQAIIERMAEWFQMAPPDSTLDGVIERDPVSVETHTSQKEVAYLVAKYDLLAVPVVNQDQMLLGIVTVDDAIDAVLPTAWKKRISRFFGPRRM